MAKDNEINKLRERVELMDTITHDAFKRIEAVCRLALMAMEQPHKPVALESLAHLLELIEYTATDTDNTIGCIAEEGSYSRDDDSQAWRRRMDAWRAWDELRAGRDGQ